MGYYPPPGAAMPAPPPPVPARRPPGAGTGVLLIVPAALLALLTLVYPTGRTIVRSLQDWSPLSRARFTGLDNYGDVLSDDDFWGALGFSLSLAILPLLTAVLVAPLLAAALDRAGTALRRTGRVLLSLPLVVFSPVAVAVAWVQGQSPREDGDIATMFGRINEPSARPTVVLITAAAFFGAILGLCLLCYLPVLRGREPGQGLPPAMIAVAAIAALATLAVGLQAYTFSSAIGGGPDRSTESLAYWHYMRSLVTFQFGAGSAAATLTGLILGVLGVAATAIAVGTRLRVKLLPRMVAPQAQPLTGQSGASRTPAILLAVVALVLVGLVVLAGSWPWLSAWVSSWGGPGTGHADEIYPRTWIPAIVVAIISVGAAYIAALGIGGLRPLGDRSEWLLMPFAPWLFVGTGPLALANLETVKSLDLLDSDVRLLSPILLCVPALLILTLNCRGQSEGWREQVAAGAPAAPAFFRTVVVPSLPLAGLLAGAVTLINAQGLLWPVTMSSFASAPVALLRSLRQYGLNEAPVGLTTPIVVVVLALAVLILLQMLYLDRLAITTERKRPVSPQPWKN